MSLQSNDAYNKMFPMTPRGYRFKPMESEDGAGMRNANSPLNSQRRYRHFNDGTGLAVREMTPAELHSLRINVRNNNELLRSFDNRIANIEDKKISKKRKRGGKKSLKKRAKKQTKRKIKNKLNKRKSYKTKSGMK